MFLEIANVLTAPELERLRQLARSARFDAGSLSNPHSKVKRNEQVSHQDPAYAESSKLMAAALQRCEPFRDFAFPRIMAPPMLARYAPGMAYGQHTDAAFLPVGGRPLRSDLSCTLFITEPGAYDGGELAIQLGSKIVTFKGEPGSAVVYTSTTLHEVRPVTRGERLVGLTFIESTVPDATFRDLLYTLNEVAALEGLNMSWENRTRLQYVRNNLHRMWGEPG